MGRKAFLISFLTSFLFVAACGINSVTKAQLEAVKPGDVVVYRYKKDGKDWFYADKITRVTDDKVYYNPGRQEVTAGNDSRVYDYDTSRELVLPKVDFVNFADE